MFRSSGQVSIPSCYLAFVAYQRLCGGPIISADVAILWPILSRTRGQRHAAPYVIGWAYPCSQPHLARVS